MQVVFDGWYLNPQALSTGCFVEPVMALVSGANRLDERKLAALRGVGRKKVKRADADTASMYAMAAQVPPGAVWSGFGIGRMQMPMVAQTVLLGGHVRVGLEDGDAVAAAHDDRIELGLQDGLAEGDEVVVPE